MVLDYFSFFSTFHLLAYFIRLDTQSPFLKVATVVQICPNTPLQKSRSGTSFRSRTWGYFRLPDRLYKACDSKTYARNKLRPQRYKSNKSVTTSCNGTKKRHDLLEYLHVSKAFHWLVPNVSYKSLDNTQRSETMRSWYRQVKINLKISGQVPTLFKRRLGHFFNVSNMFIFTGPATTQ